VPLDVAMSPAVASIQSRRPEENPRHLSNGAGPREVPAPQGTPYARRGPGSKPHLCDPHIPLRPGSTHDCTPPAPPAEVPVQREGGQPTQHFVNAHPVR
jgi:hypothetical protein